MNTEDGGIICNLWYVTNRTIISSLRAKAYVASGSDDEKLQFLRKRANHDFHDAQVHPIPEDLKADVHFVDGSTEVAAGKACAHATLEFMGGYPALFREILQNTPKTSFRFDPRQAMMCITCLEKGHDGKLSVRIDKTTQLRGLTRALQRTCTPPFRPESWKTSDAVGALNRFARRTSLSSVVGGIKSTAAPLFKRGNLFTQVIIE